MAGRSSIFDMIGPIMIGPSSSHTAGVARIGRIVRLIFGVQPEKVLITFYNSFAHTYEGHGSDRAVAAGLLSLATDDPGIRNALELAAKAGMNMQFRSVLNASHFHPNSIRIEASTGEKTIEVLGISRGGGLITITELDGYRCSFTCEQHTLIITADDTRGSVAFITSVMAHDNCNIASMTVDRKAKNHSAKLVLEMDSGLKPITIEYLRQLSWIQETIYIPGIQI